MADGLEYVATTRNGAAIQIHAATPSGRIKTLDLSQRDALRIMSALSEHLLALQPRDRT